ncbi:MAG: histone-lysine N-methyltransferase [Candidatus Altiarchaeales archaeon]|nr:histone-lysine N-methyltransferase [Candidatus Altiarchaeales archaeon]
MISEKPNLQREYFPLQRVPSTDFNSHTLPEDICITDSTFRDGQQARPPYRVEQIVSLYTLLHELDNNQSVIKQSEFFLYSPSDRQAVKKCLALGFEYPQVTGWIRANPKDFRLVKDMGLSETGILTSSSDYHIHLKLGWSRSKALEKYISIAGEAMSFGITPRCHFEDVTRSDFTGFTLPLAQRLLDLSEKTGVDVKIRLCDTLGLGLPYEGVPRPRGVGQVVESIRELGYKSSQLEWHGHNDFHLALANSLAAWRAGCGAVNGTLVGFGERTGNTPVEGVLIHLMGLRPNCAPQTKKITEIANYLRGIGTGIPDNYPLVGSEFNNTSAGIHIDGIRKHPEVYTIFDTEAILGVPAGVNITDKSGISGILHWIETNLGGEKAAGLSKRHPGVCRIKKVIEGLYRQGRTSAVSSEEMLELAKKHLPELFISDFDKIEAKAKTLAVSLIEEYADQGAVKGMNPVVLQRMMMEMEFENPFIQAAFVTDAAGKLVTVPATSDEVSELYRGFTPGTDCSNRSWYTQPVKNNSSHVTGFYDSRITRELCITASTPITDDAGLLGVLSIDLNFKELAKLI